MVFYKRSCCPPSAAVLTLPRQQRAQHLKQSHEHGVPTRRNDLRRRSDGLRPRTSSRSCGQRRPAWSGRDRRLAGGRDCTPLTCASGANCCRSRSVPNRNKHRARAGRKQQRHIVAHQKLIELQIEIRHEHGHSEQVRRDLRDSRYGNLQGYERRDGSLTPSSGVSTRGSCRGSYEGPRARTRLPAPIYGKMMDCSE